jgi:type IV secretion system protein VirD4
MAPEREETKASTPAANGRTVNKKALRAKPAKKASGGAGGENAKENATAIENRIKAVEDGLKPSAERLKESVARKVEKLGDQSPTKRRNYLDIFSATVPDPLEVGIVSE